MKRLALIAAGLLLTTGAFAQTTDAQTQKRLAVDAQRNANQQQRIEQGVKSGELTPAETSKLEAGQARVERKEARAAADGKVTPAEQHSIQKSENRQSRRIHRKKHNAQTTK